MDTVAGHPPARENITVHVWQVFFGSHYLGDVRAESEREAIKEACFAFGQHMRGAITVRRVVRG